MDRDDDDGGPRTHRAGRQLSSEAPQTGLSDVVIMVVSLCPPHLPGSSLPPPSPLAVTAPSSDTRDVWLTRTRFRSRSQLSSGREPPLESVVPPCPFQASPDHDGARSSTEPHHPLTGAFRFALGDPRLFRFALGVGPPFRAPSCSLSPLVFLPCHHHHHHHRALHPSLWTAANRSRDPRPATYTRP